MDGYDQNVVCVVHAVYDLVDFHEQDIAINLKDSNCFRDVVLIISVYLVYYKISISPSLTIVLPAQSISYPALARKTINNIITKLKLFSPPFL